jgi:hypothetical protein
LPIRLKAGAVPDEDLVTSYWHQSFHRLTSSTFSIVSVDKFRHLSTFSPLLPVPLQWLQARKGTLKSTEKDASDVILVGPEGGRIRDAERSERFSWTVFHLVHMVVGRSEYVYIYKYITCISNIFKQYQTTIWQAEHFLASATLVTGLNGLTLRLVVSHSGCRFTSKCLSLVLRFVVSQVMIRSMAWEGWATQSRCKQNDWQTSRSSDLSCLRKCHHAASCLGCPESEISEMQVRSMQFRKLATWDESW